MKIFRIVVFRVVDVLIVLSRLQIVFYSEYVVWLSFLKACVVNAKPIYTLLVFYHVMIYQFRQLFRVIKTMLKAFWMQLRPKDIVLFEVRKASIEDDLARDDSIFNQCYFTFVEFLIYFSTFHRLSLVLVFRVILDSVARKVEFEDFSPRTDFLYFVRGNFVPWLRVLKLLEHGLSEYNQAGLIILFTIKNRRTFPSYSIAFHINFFT